MAQFSVNTQRFDPYKNFKFRIKWDGKYVAGVKICTTWKMCPLENNSAKVDQNLMS